MSSIINPKVKWSVTTTGLLIVMKVFVLSRRNEFFKKCLGGAFGNEICEASNSISVYSFENKEQKRLVQWYFSSLNRPADSL